MVSTEPPAWFLAANRLEFQLDELLQTLFCFCFVKNILTYPDMWW
jgi:hypothetical protein